MATAIGRKSIFVVFVAAFSAFLATFNETFMNVALTPIMTDLDIGASTVQWLATAFMIGAAIMVPVTGFLYRSVPTRRLFLIALALLLAGTAVGGLAVNFPMLIIARVIQAVGTGMAIPIGMNITLAIAPKRKLGTYMGVVGAMTTLGPSSSPVVAGIVLAFFDWHMLFWVYAILVALCLVLAFLTLPDIGELSHPTLDMPSIILVSLALIGVFYGIATVFGTAYIQAIVSLAAGVIFLGIFLNRQRHLAEPLIDIRPFSVKPFSLGLIILIIALMTVFAMNILLPLFMQGALGFTALHAALTLFPAVICACILSPVAGRLYDRYGIKMLFGVGLALMAVFELILALTAGMANSLTLALFYVPVIIGSAFVIGPSQSFSLSRLPRELRPHGVTILSTSFQIAGCIGSSLFVGVYSGIQGASFSSGASVLDSNTLGFTVAGILGAALAAGGFFIARHLAHLKTETEHAPAPARTLGDIAIKAVMKTEVYSVTDDASVYDALQCMTDNRTSGIPILTDDGTMVGFIVDGDIFRFLSGGDPDTIDIPSIYALWEQGDDFDSKLIALKTINVLELATRRVIAVEHAAGIHEVCRALSSKLVKKVPVTENGHVVGTVSRSDLMRYLVHVSTEKID